MARTCQRLITWFSLALAGLLGLAPHVHANDPALNEAVQNVEQAVHNAMSNPDRAGNPDLRTIGGVSGAESSSGGGGGGGAGGGGGGGGGGDGAGGE